MAKRFVNFSVPDSIDIDGLWVSNFCVTKADTYELYHSRAASLWQGVRKRTNDLGYYKKVKPTYQDCTNHFTDFQEFAEWCNSQELYVNFPDEKLQLDKDILIPGNKEYSPDKCCFVPNFINSLFKDGNKRRGEFPLGVYWREKHRKFVAQCNNSEGKRKHLGHFSTEGEAHKAWQIFKAATIRTQARKYQELKGSRLDVYEALISRAISIEDDLVIGVETLRIF